MTVKRHLHILLYILLGAWCLASCGLEGDSFRIKGHFRDMQGGELYIYNLSDDHALFDTLTIQDGRFLYRGQAESVTPYMLVFPNGMEQVIFVGPGHDLEYEATANDMKNYVVNGSDENQLMNQFRQETYTLNPSMVVAKARTYIKENPESPVAIYLLDRYFVQDDKVSDAETSELLRVVKGKHPHNHYLLDLDTKMVQRQRNQVGKKLPDVTLTKKDYSTVKLWSKEKDYHLLAFWAIWMPNSYDFLWQLRQRSNEYKESGKLRIVAISLDIERYRWEESIRPDSTNNIEHYCDGMGFESKVIKTLGVGTLPCFVLTDNAHRILEKSNDLAQIGKKIEEYIK